MLPFQFVVAGVPVSLQTRNRPRLQAWKELVAVAAEEIWASDAPDDGDVEFQLTLYYDGAPPDVDNVIKPIQDALVGIVYVDDVQVVKTSSRKRDINGSYRIRHANAALLQAFSEGTDFVHVLVTRFVESGDLNA